MIFIEISAKNKTYKAHVKSWKLLLLIRSLSLFPYAFSIFYYTKYFIDDPRNKLFC